MISRDDAEARWRSGNDAGNGYAPYTDVAGDDTVEAAVDAAIADGGELILASTNTSEIVVLRMADGGLLGIGGDGMGRGAWAVDLGTEDES